MFRPLNKQGEPLARSRWAVGDRIEAIAKLAGVIVGEREKFDEDGKAYTVKEYASAHDLRRAFGVRWARRVMPTVLRELMRHTTVETTMRYYVGQDAEATADELWQAIERNAASKLIKPTTAVDDGSGTSTNVLNTWS